MKTWCTTIYAKCPLDGQMKKYCGPNVQAPSASLALEWCQNNGLGYCHIEGELVMEIPCDGSPSVDYDKPQQN